VLQLDRDGSVVSSRQVHNLVLRVLYLIQNLQGSTVSDYSILLSRHYQHGCPLLSDMRASPLLLIEEVADGAQLGHVYKLGVVEVVCVLGEVGRARTRTITKLDIELHQVKELVGPLVFLENICEVAEEGRYKC